MAAQVLCIYALADLPHFQALRRHLQARPDLLVCDWHGAPPGVHLADARAAFLARAQAVVLLLSVDFVNDPICRSAAAEVAHRQPIPVLLRATPLPPELAGLALVPSDGVPLVQQPADRDAQFFQIAQAVFTTVAVSPVVGPRAPERSPSSSPVPAPPIAMADPLAALAGDRERELLALRTLRDEQDARVAKQREPLAEGLETAAQQLRGELTVTQKRASDAVTQRDEAERLAREAQGERARLVDINRENERRLVDLRDKLTQAEARVKVLERERGEWQTLAEQHEREAVRLKDLNDDKIVQLRGLRTQLTDLEDQAKSERDRLGREAARLQSDLKAARDERDAQRLELAKLRSAAPKPPLAPSAQQAEAQAQKLAAALGDLRRDVAALRTVAAGPPDDEERTAALARVTARLADAQRLLGELRPLLAG